MIRKYNETKKLEITKNIKSIKAASNIVNMTHDIIVLDKTVTIEIVTKDIEIKKDTRYYIYKILDTPKICINFVFLDPWRSFVKKISTPPPPGTFYSLRPSIKKQNSENTSNIISDI